MLRIQLNQPKPTFEQRLAQEAHRVKKSEPKLCRMVRSANEKAAGHCAQRPTGLKINWL
jgi:hypothetical protein